MSNISSYSHIALPKLGWVVENEKVVNTINVRNKQYTLENMHPGESPRSHQVWKIPTDDKIVIKTYHHEQDDRKRRLTIYDDVLGYEYVAKLVFWTCSQHLKLAKLYSEPKKDGCMIQERIVNHKKDYWKEWANVHDIRELSSFNRKILGIAAKHLAVSYEVQKNSQTKMIVSDFRPDNLLLKGDEKTFQLTIIDWSMSPKKELNMDFAHSVNAWINGNGHVREFFEGELKKHLTKDSCTSLKIAIDNEIAFKK